MSLLQLFSIQNDFNEYGLRIISEIVAKTFEHSRF